MSHRLSPSPSRLARLEERARFMHPKGNKQSHPTPPAALLFSAIRGGRLGVTFRRQVVLGDFIVDFLARKARLVVEVDGDALHDSSRARDAARDRKLAWMGYRVVRIPASVVTGDLSRAVALVLEALAE